MRDDGGEGGCGIVIESKRSKVGNPVPPVGEGEDGMEEGKGREWKRESSRPGARLE
jgi:hypothetical protein